MICRDVCPDNHVTKVPFLVAEIVTPLRPSIPDIGRRGTMAMPGWKARRTGRASTTIQLALLREPAADFIRHSRLRCHPHLLKQVPRWPRIVCLSTIRAV